MIKKPLLFLIFILQAILSPHSLEALADLSGTVTNEVTGAPISGALVEAIRGNQVRGFDITGADGTYLIEDLQPSNFTVVASAAGFQTEAIGIRLDNNTVNFLDFSLIANGGTIAGVVTESATSSPISGATIEVFEDTILIRTTTTNASGNYSAADLAPGNYVVIATATGFQTDAEGASVIQGQITTANFSLAGSPGAIAGTVTDSSTTDPIEGAFVAVFDGPILIGFADTDASGDYTIPDLAPGNYTVVSTATDFQASSVGARVSASTTTTVDFALDPGPGTIAGRVTSASTGLPLAGAAVEVFDGSTIIESTLTDPNGDYELPSLAPGNYIVIALETNFQTEISGATVTSGATTTVNFALDPNPGTLAGTVTAAATGNPIVGALIEVFDGPVFIEFALTDLSGNYTISGLAPGDYAVVAVKDDFQTKLSFATIASRTTTIVNFALEASPGTIAGTVTDSSTTDPIPNAIVAVFQNSNLIAFITTDVSGDYTIPNLAPGTYTVLANANDFRIDFSLAVVASSATTTVDFALDPDPGAISGTVSDACTGNPISGAIAIASQSGTLLSFGVSDPNGIYTLSNLTPGSYTVALLKANFVPRSAPATVIASATTTLNFILTPIPLPPLGLKGEVIRNKFLFQTDRIHRVTWAASQSSCITEYQVFRDGVLVDIVPPSGPFEYTEHNRKSDQTAVYTIVVVNSFGQTSKPVSISLQ
ncbi:MAG: Bacillopeptidase F [Chlamydiae bacterium]|nr:Bacillopeptidase F [Chlamydiota bacterium]